MKIRSAVISFSDKEINEILAKLDLPVSEISVECLSGKLLVTIKKGISIKINIFFAADGRHLSATIDMGALGNPLVSRILKKVGEKGSDGGITLMDRTLVFDPQAALINSGIKGDLRVDKIAVGAGELVMAINGDIQLEQFLNVSGKTLD